MQKKLLPLNVEYKSGEIKLIFMIPYVSFKIYLVIPSYL